ncbi:MAG: hypothetical protein ACFFE6_04150 [Candidatus Thorarchaeota archaeon]
MRIIGSAVGIRIHAPEDAYFSYFNSPYIGHDIGSAIDIYPRHQKWNGDIVSPVSGKIVRIKKMRMGKPRQFPTDEFDYGIGIIPEESESDIVRIMHCKPSVLEGESIGLGDQIGTAIRSRYFNYWTGPHYHVEILPQNAFLRSSNSHPLYVDYKIESRKSRRTSEMIEFLISSVTDDNIIGYAESLDHSTVGDLVGLSAATKKERISGILDGGLSHYRIGGVIGASDLKKNDQVYLSDSCAGIVREAKSGASLFTRGPSIMSYLDNIELRGLSCFIYSRYYTKRKTPQLILIPKRYGQFNKIFNEGDLCELRITSRNNTVKAN